MLVLVLQLLCQESLFGLAKASAAWDGGTVRLLTLTNKDSEVNSFFDSFYISSLSLFLILFVSFSLHIHFTHSQAAQDLNSY